MTLVLLSALGAVFLKGFREAVGLAVPIVAVYIVLNVIVLAWGLHYLWLHPSTFSIWSATATSTYGNPASMVLVAMLLFPRLALGLSGFETGVAVMPLVKGDPDDTEKNPKGRIRNTKKLLTSAALLMSVLLAASSIVTTLLIPPAEFAEGGAAYGRALAYIAHEHLGRRLRDHLRHQHRGDPLVRGRIGDGRAAQPGAAVSSAVRHGARVGEGAPAARGHIHGRHVSRDHPVQSRRERAGRGVRDGCPRADGLGRAGRDARGAARGSAVDWLRAPDPHLRLHHHRQHHRASGRDQDRVDLHRLHRDDVDGLARAAIHGAADSLGRTRRAGAHVHS